jgi:hypothetical protein
MVVVITQQLGHCKFQFLEGLPLGVRAYGCSLGKNLGAENRCYPCMSESELSPFHYVMPHPKLYGVVPVLPARPIPLWSSLLARGYTTLGIHMYVVLKI